MNIMYYISQFWLPVFVVAIPLLVLCVVYSKSGNNESFRTVLGITLGVVLGFGADIGKQTFDQVTKKLQLRQASIRLLKEDAKRAYHIMWMVNHVRPPQNISKSEIIPPEIDLRYWNQLKKDNQFLLQAAEPPFDKVFTELENLEKINELIRLAEKGKQEYGRLASKWYRDAWRVGSPKTLLLNFMDESSIAAYEEELRKIANTPDL